MLKWIAGFLFEIRVSNIDTMILLISLNIVRDHPIVGLLLAIILFSLSSIASDRYRKSREKSAS